MKRDSFIVELRDATDSMAIVSLVGRGSIAPLSECELYGPICAHARTLPSVTAGRAKADRTGVEFLVTEPCYWTPSLPFLYSLRLKGAGEEAGSLGLRRLIAHGRDLRLNGERIVLRGACMEPQESWRLSEARAAEMSLVVRYSERAVFDLATQTGVFIAADVTNESARVLDMLFELSWQPSVALLLLNRDQIVADRLRAARRMGMLLAQVFRSGDGGGEASVAAAADIVAIELAEGERPPAWMARIAKPVIAMRRGRVYADLHEARSACDRLQAELAPEFDLAGYFV